MSVRTLLTIVMAVVCCAVLGAAQRARKPVTHTVTMAGVQFAPPDLKIKAGDSVEWVNKDIVSHTATATSPTPFESKAVDPGKSWKRSFKAKGEFSYVCRFHPTMKGKVTVE